jgi:hypothetical protein
MVSNGEIGCILLSSKVLIDPQIMILLFILLCNGMEENATDQTRIRTQAF